MKKVTTARSTIGLADRPALAFGTAGHARPPHLRNDSGGQAGRPPSGLLPDTLSRRAATLRQRASPPAGAFFVSPPKLGD
jgi:hypothetical protein